jgi:uncharacterized repeat protein (TIGR03847 family)
MSPDDSPSFDLDTPDRFTAGTVGPPGDRTFYLQVVGEGVAASLKLEKQQVGALAEYLARLLDELPADPTPPEPGALTFVEPADADWVIGSMAVAWDGDEDRFVVVAEELLEEADGDEGVESASARFRLTRGQVNAFVQRARELITAGRPACYLCGMPMDPDGHACPRLN